MYHLRNLINRTTVPADPEKNMNAAEDFMLLLLHTHVVAAAKVMQSINPNETVADLAKLIVVNHMFTCPGLMIKLLKDVMTGSISMLLS